MDALKREMRFSAVIKMFVLFHVINTSHCLAAFFKQTHSFIYLFPQIATKANTSESTSK